MRITEMFAFISVDEKGDEGVCGATVGGVFMPMVGADLARIESLKPYAKELAKHCGMPIKLVKFTNRVELETM